MTPKKLTKDLFPIIYPNTASSETKQLEREKFSNFDLSQDTFFYTEVLFLTVSTWLF